MRPEREALPLQQPALTSFIRSALPPHGSVLIAASPLNPDAAAVWPMSGMFGFRGNLARSRFHRTTQTLGFVMSRLGRLFSQQWQATVNWSNECVSFFSSHRVARAHKWATCFRNNWYIALVSAPLTVRLLWRGVDTCSTIKLQKRARLCQKKYLPLSQGCVHVCCIWFDGQSVQFTVRCVHQLVVICMLFAMFSTFCVDAVYMKDMLNTASTNGAKIMMYMWINDFYFFCLHTLISEMHKKSHSQWLFCEHAIKM